MKLGSIWLGSRAEAVGLFELRCAWLKRCSHGQHPASFTISPVIRGVSGNQHSKNLSIALNFATNDGCRVRFLHESFGSTWRHSVQCSPQPYRTASCWSINNSLGAIAWERSSVNPDRSFGFRSYSFQTSGISWALSHVKLALFLWKVAKIGESSGLIQWAVYSSSNIVEYFEKKIEDWIYSVNWPFRSSTQY